MKKASKYIRNIVTTCLVVYIMLILLLHFPIVQNKVGSWAASALSDKIGARVEVGRVNLGLLNRIIIDDLKIYDRQGKPLLSAARTAASIELTPLITTGRITVNTAQLFGLKAHLAKANPKAPLNCQFIIDAFKSKKQKSSSPIDLHIFSILIRHADISYDVLSETPTPGRFNASHLDVKDFTLTAMLRTLTPDSLNAEIKRLSLTESHSGLRIQHLATSIIANQDEAILPSVLIELNHSKLQIGRTHAYYHNYKNDKKFSVSSSIDASNFHIRDFGVFFQPLKRLGQDINLSVNRIEATQDRLKLTKAVIQSGNNDMSLHTSATVTGYLSAKPAVHVPHLSFHLSERLADELAADLALPDNIRHTASLCTPLSLTLKADHDSLQTEVHAQIDSRMGHVKLDGQNTTKGLTAEIDVKALDLQNLLNIKQAGKTSFQLTAHELKKSGTSVSGRVDALVGQLDYAGHTYQNLTLHAEADKNDCQGEVRIDDPYLKLALEASASAVTTPKDLKLNTLLDISGFNPHALGLTTKYANQVYSLRMSTSTQGLVPQSMTGDLHVDSLSILTPEQNYTTGTVDLSVHPSAHGRMLTLSSSFANARIEGDVTPQDIIASFKNQLAAYMPALFPGHRRQTTRSAFQFDITLADSPILHHFIKADYALPERIEASGSLNSPLGLASFNIQTPRFVYDGTEYDNIHLQYEGTPDAFNAQATALRRLENSALSLDVTATGSHDMLCSAVSWNQASRRPSKGVLATRTRFSNPFGKTQIHVDIDPTDISLNDTVWHVGQSSVDVVGKHIDCNGIKISNAERFLTVNGAISDSDADSLMVRLNDIQVEYVLDLVNFTAVGFRGRASGQAKISNIYKKPQFDANLRVEHFSLEDGDLGTAYIHADWDNQVDGIRIGANIYDQDNQGADRITQCHGYISPSQNEIQLRIDADNTDAYFLESFLGSVFDQVEGSVNGTINIVGPLGDIGIIGDVSTNLSFRLRATNVNYRISPSDTIRLRPYRFNFDRIHITDREGNQGVVNGYVTHKNVKNFAYVFQVEMKQLLAYEETQFNADKFMGKVYANGHLSLQGADRHPLYIEADVTPTRGSTFAYDTATPDAITTSSFITFSSSRQAADTLAVDSTLTHTKPLDEDDLQGSTHWTNADYLLYYHNKAKQPKQKSSEYTGDIYMDVDMHLNPNCAIKLRMDNADDGYITTYGTGNLQALYHNKGSFTLSGTYAIHSGRYRLYLQDIIYRDLNIQDGSSVVFNGNPFDANIHLICWHTLNSVPLSELTGSTSSFASNKVKVNCILDITGKLGNMNFKFDLNLPNVTEETRQLVRSLISTDEEMNMQMIYLLGVGRFYSNGQANPNNENANTQAVNSLLSSTISGQINQMLSNIIGTNSKWNFGTGLSTGELGWQDLDIEGLLSGSLLDDRLLINGNFGYRDNALKQSSSFIGDFDVKWRLKESGNTYLKAYNKSNDRYFTKATLNTQGVGLSYQKDFESWRTLFQSFRRKRRQSGSAAADSATSDTLHAH